MAIAAIIKNKIAKFIPFLFKLNNYVNAAKISNYFRTSKYFSVYFQFEHRRNGSIFVIA